MMIDREARKRLFEAVAQRVIASADELTDLDRAIGDGDHGANMRRGFEAVLAAVDELSAKNLGESLKGVGTTAAWGTSLTAAMKKVLQQAETVKGKWQQRKRSADSVRTMPPAAPVRASRSRKRA